MLMPNYMDRCSEVHDQTRRFPLSETRYSFDRRLTFLARAFGASSPDDEASSKRSIPSLFVNESTLVETVAPSRRFLPSLLH